ncbi:hypothetical protein BD779DRAFT_1669152 [Infundibulicybe gibba]|nr:hypothetical protein BD779DRAFT_1669152 [Infundibulicybe gibba]
MDATQAIFPHTNATERSSGTAIYHLLSGSFRSLSLFLLAFSPTHRNISLVQPIDAFGPHQYIACNRHKNRVYTTSWALPPILSSWEVERSADRPWRVNHINSVPITATSSYISIPPPFGYIYSVGGPTGEAHHIDPSTGGFGPKVQEILFVPEGELESADKTRVALRYGSHGIEFSPASGHAFVPVLGTSSIEMYTHNPLTGTLSHMASVPSPRGPSAHDGPRHVKVHPNGKVLYSVTEHTNLLDVYAIKPTSLEYVSSQPLLPPDLPSDAFRGDTLLLTPSTPSHPTPHTIFATTRGSKTLTNGWLSIFSLGDDGLFSGKVERFQTATSGGKANALDILPKAPEKTDSEAVWIALTDDDEHTATTGGGGVRVLEWDGWNTNGVHEVTAWPPALQSPPEQDAAESSWWMKGGSHAIWLD